MVLRHLAEAASLGSRLSRPLGGCRRPWAGLFLGTPGLTASHSRMCVSWTVSGWLWRESGKVSLGCECQPGLRPRVSAIREGVSVTPVRSSSPVQLFLLRPVQAVSWADFNAVDPFLYIFQGWPMACLLCPLPGLWVPEQRTARPSRPYMTATGDPVSHGGTPGKGLLGGEGGRSNQQTQCSGDT